MPSHAHAAHETPPVADDKKEPVDPELALQKAIPGKSIGAVIHRIAARCDAAKQMGAAFPTCFANALHAEAEFLEPGDASILTVEAAKAKVEALRHAVGADVLVLDNPSATAAERAEALKKISAL